MSWPPPGLGNADALADIYNVFFSKAKESGMSDTDAHQHSCDEIRKMGWHEGYHAGSCAMAEIRAPLKRTEDP